MLSLLCYRAGWKRLQSCTAQMSYYPEPLKTYVDWPKLFAGGALICLGVALSVIEIKAMVGA
jgi:hypothetical protein